MSRFVRITQPNDIYNFAAALRGSGAGGGRSERVSTAGRDRLPEPLASRDAAFDIEGDGALQLLGDLVRAVNPPGKKHALITPRWIFVTDPTRLAVIGLHPDRHIELNPKHGFVGDFFPVLAIKETPEFIAARKRFADGDVVEGIPQILESGNTHTTIVDGQWGWTFNGLSNSLTVVGEFPDDIKTLVDAAQLGSRSEGVASETAS